VSAAPYPQSVIVFEAAGQRFALDAARVREILPMAALSRPPALPPLLEGFLNLGGVPAPVLRLARLFRLPERAPERYTPLILLAGEAPLALMVESVHEVTAVSPAEWVPLPAGQVVNDCALALFERGGVPAHLLAPERLLLEAEARRVAELRAAEELRLRELEGRAA
jgi:purine-binding chemotaxis protein CheW